MKPNYSTHTYKVDKTMWKFSNKRLLNIPQDIHLDQHEAPMSACSMRSDNEAACVMFKLSEEGCCGRPTELKDFFPLCGFF